MIGGDDRHDFDVFAVEQLAIVFIDFNGPLAAFLGVLFEGLGLALRRVLGIDVADGDAIGKVHRLRADGVPAVARADAAEDGAVVFAFRLGVLGDQWRCPGEIRHAGDAAAAALVFRKRRREERLVIGRAFG